MLICNHELEVLSNEVNNDPRAFGGDLDEPFAVTIWHRTFEFAFHGELDDKVFIQIGGFQEEF